MAIKVTFSSNHPEFKSFGDWADDKMQALEAAGNKPEADKIRAAIAAKAAANTHVTVENSDVNVEGSVTKESTVQNEITERVPEFDVYFDEWQQHYNVEIIQEEV
jgi:hypothetical protein